MMDVEKFIDNALLRPEINDGIWAISLHFFTITPSVKYFERHLFFTDDELKKMFGTDEIGALMHHDLHCLLAVIFPGLLIQDCQRLNEAGHPDFILADMFDKLYGVTSVSVRNAKKRVAGRGERGPLSHFRGWA